MPTTGPDADIDDDVEVEVEGPDGAPDDADGAPVDEGRSEPTPKPKKKKGKKKPKVVVQEITPAWVWWGAAVAALLVVVALTAAVLQWQRADDAAAERHARQAAGEVAGEFSQTLFTYDAANPTASLDRLRQLATTAYQPKVDSARQTAAGSPAAANQLNMSAQVVDVYLTDLTGDTAKAVSHSNVVLQANGQSLPLELYLQIDLRREGGAWKVNDVNAITLRQPAGSAPPATTPATTPATAASSGG